jgi:nidogen-like/PEP-CTERM motif-containing protein
MEPIRLSSTTSVIAGVLALLLGTGTAQAITTIPDSALVASTTYYTDTIGGGIGSALVMTGGGNASNIGGSPNDDGFSGPITLGYTLSFFGNTYTSFFANNNGNISFNAGIPNFTPSGPTGASQPIMSPFFADVDTRDPASGLMSLRNDIANETIVTWDHVGYYSAHGDLLNSFQLVFRGPDYLIPAGEGAIGFFYRGMQWETGDASGGSGGFGGSPGAVGFGNGLGSGEVLQSSTANGISSVVNNHHIWFDANLAPIPPSDGVPGVPGVPEPSSLLLLGAGLAGLGVWRKFKGLKS